MKILYYSSHPTLTLDSPAGYATHMREMIKAFETMEHTVHPVIMGRKSRTLNDKFNWNGRDEFKSSIKYLLPGYIWSSLKDVELMKFSKNADINLNARLKTWRPDIIYERAHYLNLTGINAAKNHGVHHILELNSPLVDERIYFGGRTFYYRKAKTIEKMQLEQTSMAVVVSTALREYFESEYGIDKEKMLVVPNGINPEHVNIDREKQSDVVTRFDLTGKVVIGFVGSFFKWHGLDILMKAFSSLRQTEHYAVLLIVGDGAIRKELEQLKRELNLNDCVHFTGSVPYEEVYSYIDIMDITVLPDSNWYGSPVKLFEYGASGKPIIAPDKGPVRDVMRDGIDGLLISPSKTDLLSKLKLLIHNQDLQKKIGNNFRQKIYRKYTWGANSKNILQYFFENIMSPKR